MAAHTGTRAWAITFLRSFIALLPQPGWAQITVEPPGGQTQCPRRVIQAAATASEGRANAGKLENSYQKCRGLATRLSERSAERLPGLTPIRPETPRAGLRTARNEGILTESNLDKRCIVDWKPVGWFFFVKESSWRQLQVHTETNVQTDVYNYISIINVEGSRSVCAHLSHLGGLQSQIAVFRETCGRGSAFAAWRPRSLYRLKHVTKEELLLLYLILYSFFRLLPAKNIQWGWRDSVFGWADSIVSTIRDSWRWSLVKAS